MLRSLALVTMLTSCTWQQRGLVAGGIGVTGGLIVAADCDRACAGSRWVSYPLVGIIIPAALWGLYELVRLASESQHGDASGDQPVEPVAPDGANPEN